MAAVRILPKIVLSLALTLVMALPEPGWGASLEDRLAAARLELEIGIATENRIQQELETYRNSGEASPDRIALYETYLDRVHQLTEEKRKIVQRLEQARQNRPKTDPNAAPGTAPLPPPSLDIPEDQELDELRALERELDQSLAAFDDMLLTEGEVARVQSELKMKRLAQEAAEAARNLREGQGGEGGEGEGTADGDTGMEDGTSTSAEGDQAGENSQQGGMEGEEGEEGQEGDADKQDGSQETGGGRDRAKRPSKSSPGQGEDAMASKETRKPQSQDDDIVARQLREAAEKETDPVLKEKLWKEYYDYKKGL